MWRGKKEVVHVEIQFKTGESAVVTKIDIALSQIACR